MIDRYMSAAETNAWYGIGDGRYSPDGPTRCPRMTAHVTIGSPDRPGNWTIWGLGTKVSGQGFLPSPAEALALLRQEKSAGKERHRAKRAAGPVEMVKVTVYVDRKTLKRWRSECRKMGLTMSAFIRMHPGLRVEGARWRGLAGMVGGWEGSDGLVESVSTIKR